MNIKFKPIFTGSTKALGFKGFFILPLISYHSWKGEGKFVYIGWMFFLIVIHFKKKSYEVNK